MTEPHLRKPMKDNKMTFTTEQGKGPTAPAYAQQYSGDQHPSKGHPLYPGSFSLQPGEKLEITGTGPIVRTAPGEYTVYATSTDSKAGYNPLKRVLDLAFDQAASGKGKERHANDKDFLQQPIMEIGRMVGIGYQLGQAMKKAQEAGGMHDRGQHNAAKGELLGAINYLAAAYLQIDEGME